jgi:hypothetical protein
MRIAFTRIRGYLSPIALAVVVAACSKGPSSGPSTSQTSAPAVQNSSHITLVFVPVTGIAGSGTSRSDTLAHTRAQIENLHLFRPGERGEVHEAPDGINIDVWNASPLDTPDRIRATLDAASLPVRLQLESITIHGDLAVR